MAAIQYFALAALAAFARAQSIDTLDNCGKECYTQALNNAATYNCAAMDMDCLCLVQDWTFAVRDCAKNICPPGYEATVTSAVAALCATATLPPGAEATMSQTTSEEGEAPTTTEAPTSTLQSSSEATSTSASSPSSSATTLETTTSAAASTSTAAAAPTKVVADSTTSAAAAPASSSEAPTDEVASPGLTEAAKIGIGVGVGAAIIGLATVAACVMLRRRAARNTASTVMDRYKISGPMPSNEHAYTHNNNSDYDIGSSELVAKSRRYEEMMAGEQPRQMV